MECNKICDSDSKVQQAEREFSKGNFIAAVIFYSEVIGEDSRNIKCLTQRSECLRKLNEYNLALKDVLLSIEIDKTQHKLHERLIEINLGLGNIHNVENLIKQLQTLFPHEIMNEKILTNYETLKNSLTKIDDSFKNGDFEECLKNVNKSTFIAVASDDLKLLKTELLVITNRVKSARSFYKENFTNNKHLEFLKALICFYRGNFERCGEIMKTLDECFNGNQTYETVKTWPGAKTKGNNL